jgi:tetratricopeptide (TPR) repeat protein
MLKRQQWIVAAVGAVLLFSLFTFGKFTPPHTPHDDHTEGTTPAAQAFDFQSFLSSLKKDLTPSQSAVLTKLEESITRGDLATQRKSNYEALSNFWKDSARSFIPYIYYLGEKAKLENSEKNLTFAAHSMLVELRGLSDPGLRSWMANETQSLFSQALKINSKNDSTIIGWGSTFFFGASGAPMEGILKIREVAERDPNNSFAQFMLGYGSMVSGQTDKAIERLKKTVELDSENPEAVFLLAEIYEKDGKKKEALEWYQKGLLKVRNPDLVKALEEKINSLK